MKETLDKLVLKAHEGKVVYHVSRDSTAIEAREKAQKKEKKEENVEKKPRGRPKKGAIRPPKPETTLERPVHETAEESLKNKIRHALMAARKTVMGIRSFG